MPDTPQAPIRRAVGAPLHPPPTNPAPDPFNVEIPVEPDTPTRRHPSEPSDPTVEDPFGVDLPADPTPPPSIH